MEDNPYKPPEMSGVNASQEGCKVALHGSRKLRFCLIVISGSIGSFGAWCVLDFVLVRFVPSTLHHFDCLGILLPVVVIAIGGAAFLRDLPAPERFALAIGAAFLAVIVAIVLVFVFGIPFHVWIGGSL